MKLEEARSIMWEVDQRSYWYLEAWGLGTIREAIRTIWDRKSATDADREKAERTGLTIRAGQN